MSFRTNKPRNRSAWLSGITLLCLGALLAGGCPVASAAAVDNAIPPVRQLSGSQEPAASYLVVENMGQYAAEARFLLTHGDQRIWLTDDAVWLTVPDPAATGEPVEPAAADSLHPARRNRQPAAGARSGTALRFTFPGAVTSATLEPFDRVPTHVSYLIGNNPALWQRDVPVWSGVRYRDLYPGIDLVIGGDATGALPWRLEARPGANTQAVTLRVEGADMVTAETGQLRLEMKGHAVSLALPAWSTEGQANPVGSAVVGQAGDAAFVVAPESQAGQASVAGPTGVTDAGDLIYSTFLGGAGGDAGYGIAVDYLGNTYVTGETASADFPETPGSYDFGYDGATDAFVAKLNFAGTALLYATYLGGTDQDLGGGIAVSGSLAYVVGETRSTDFPGPTAAVGENDIFVVALNATGNDARYVSLLGGAGFDYGYGIAVEGANAYVVGNTFSTDLPGTNCGINSATGDLVVARLDETGAPWYTTCLGGSGFQAGYAIAVRSGIAYVAGQSGTDILAAKVDAYGYSTSTLIGGSAEEWGSGIAVDGAGNTYIAGTTGSANFPTTAGAVFGGLTDAVVLKLGPGFVIDANYVAAFLGGTGDDDGYAIAVDTVQGLYVAGSTDSTDFPVTTGAVPNGGVDVFAARMHLAPYNVTYVSYLGGAQDDWDYGVATDTGGHAFITGVTGSTAFPTSINAYDAQMNGVSDTFVAKLTVSSPPDAPVVTITAIGVNAVLDWNSVPTASKYQVFRSSAPYFKPGDWSSLLPLVEPTSPTHSDNGVLTPVNAYFYVVKAVSAAPEASADSNRVGKFTFGLTPGN